MLPRTHGRRGPTGTKSSKWILGRRRAFGQSEPAGKREADAGRDHRCSPSVDGLDDSVGVDALQIDRGHAEVAVAELALDDVERTPSWASSIAWAWRSWCGAKRR